MSSLIPHSAGVNPGAAQPPAAVSGGKALSPVRPSEDAAPARAARPAADEYVPEETREPSGRYWLEKGEDGRPKIMFDGPVREETDQAEPAREERADGAERKAGAAERCTGSTDRVDREIEQLKKKKVELERQLGAETDAARVKELEGKLAQVERELRQKDNDAYRRRHTVFS